MTRIVKFAIAGAGGFVVQIATLAALLAAHVYYVAAIVVAVEAAILLNFVFHERWTWNDRGRESGIARFLRFNALTAVTSIGGSIIVTTFLVETVSISPIVANAISVIVLGAVNFVGSDRFVFRTAALAALIVVAPSAQASEEAILRARTASDFAKYVAAVETRRARDIANHRAVSRHRAAAGGAAGDARWPR